jgi:hypothetical protein
MTSYTKKANYLAVDGTTVHVTGTYANGMPKIQIKLGGLGDENIIISPTHRGRDGEPFTSTVYLRLVRVLQKAGVKWDAREDSTLADRMDDFQWSLVGHIDPQDLTDLLPKDA